VKRFVFTFGEVPGSPWSLQKYRAESYFGLVDRIVLNLVRLITCCNTTGVSRTRVFGNNVSSQRSRPSKKSATSMKDKALGALVLPNEDQLPKRQGFETTLRSL